MYIVLPSTFSIVGFDPDTGDLGVAVASKFLAVGYLVPWVEIDVGAVATQSYVNVKFGPIGLELLKEDFKPKEVVDKLLSVDKRREYRQLGVVSKDGAYAYTGSRCMEWAGHIIGDFFSVQGNILVGEEVVEEMADSYESAGGELIDKLLASLEAGDEVGGDRRGKQSAALIVMRRCGGYGGCEEGVGKYVDIRVDDHKEPVKELQRIFKLWELTFLEREDPNDIVYWSDVWNDVADALKKLGYLSVESEGPEDKELHSAFEKWIGVNNFENKLRKDGVIWGTIYRYLINMSK